MKSRQSVKLTSNLHLLELYSHASIPLHRVLFMHWGKFTLPLMIRQHRSTRWIVCGLFNDAVSSSDYSSIE
jgi:hypothetical protein